MAACLLGTVPFSVLIPKRGSLQNMPTSIMPSFMSEIRKNTVHLMINHRNVLVCVCSQTKLKHTSEEHGVSPRVAFGRGNLVLYVAKDCFGDFIQSLGTILQEKEHFTHSATEQGRLTVNIRGSCIGPKLIRKTF